MLHVGLDVGQVLVVFFGHGFDHSDDMGGGGRELHQARSGQAQGANLRQQRGSDLPLSFGVVVLVVEPDTKNYQSATRVGKL